MQDDFLKDFFLVGGTALALQIGHRISVDIDLFSVDGFDKDEMLAYLEDHYSFRLDYENRNTLKGEINGIKVDLITHAYPLIKPLIIEEGIRMTSPEDISAMKLNAISGNGTRLKDFIDIAYLSSLLTLTEMVEAYEAKYSSRNPAMVVKALDYHKDINFDEKIQMINGSYNWKNIEARLNKMTLQPRKLFGQVPFDEENKNVKKHRTTRRMRLR
ncbi:MAG: hypothetical protein NVSMB24_37810 [Mucilaginibacter sp.]